MKFNYRKVSAIAASTVMLLSTVGLAAATNYPAPFVVGGSANVAIVYGTGTGVSILDVVEADHIENNLRSYISGTDGTSTTIVTGGDSVKFEKTSTKFHLGKGILDISSTSITDDKMKNLLADGKYIDNDNDEFDFTQKIDMANLSFAMFEDNDYAEDEPTLGFKLASATPVLNYTLDFTDTPLWSDLATTDFAFLGKAWYVLSVTENTTLNLLDAAQSTTLKQGESATLTIAGETYEVSLDFVGSSTVRFTVNGVATNALSAGDTQKIVGAYIGVKSIDSQSYEGGLKQAEFSIGTGKLKIVSGSDIELNDEAISGLSTTFTNTASSSGTVLSTMLIVWKTEDESFITPNSDLVMPGFKALKLSYTGMIYPAEEAISVKQGGDKYITLDNFPLKTSTEDINILYGEVAGVFNGTGKDANNRLITTNNTALTFDGDTDDAFIASWSDGSDSESYLMKATNWKVESSVNKTTIQYKKDGVWTTKNTDAKDADTVSLGNIELTLSGIEKTDKKVTITAGTNVKFNTLYSKEGMKIYLPYLTTYDAAGTGNVTGAFVATGGVNWTLGHNSTAVDLVLSEEDKNSNVGSGNNITLRLSWDSSTTAEAEVGTVSGGLATSTEILDTDVWRDFVYSALATEILYNKPTSGQRSVILNYHGDESYGEVYLTSPEATITPGTPAVTAGTQLGPVLVEDSEVSSVSSKHLIIVGGSCINSAAAKVLGVGTRTCGSNWETATGVGSGQFLIQSVDGAYTEGKIALVVAGYDAADTVNAATYLRNKLPDITAGKKYKGTSSTSAELVVE